MYSSYTIKEYKEGVLKMEICKKKKIKKSYYELTLKNSDISNYFEDYYEDLMINGKEFYVFMIDERDIFSIEKSAIKKLNQVTSHTCDCEACRQVNRVLVLI